MKMPVARGGPRQRQRDANGKPIGKPLQKRAVEAGGGGDYGHPASLTRFSEPRSTSEQSVGGKIFVLEAANETWT